MSRVTDYNCQKLKHTVTYCKNPKQLQRFKKDRAGSPKTPPDVTNDMLLSRVVESHNLLMISHKGDLF